MNENNKQVTLGKQLLNLPFILITILIFFSIGWYTKKWEYVWMVYMLNLPYYYVAWRLAYPNHKKYYSILKYFAIASYVYVGYGIVFRVWHPTWLIFLLVLIHLWLKHVFISEE